METLVRAILEDDRSRARKLLESEPGFANGTFEGAMPCLEFGHWIYAGDTALHLAAAGHRREIAALLLEAGADPNAEGGHRDARPLHYASDGNPNLASWSASRQARTIELLIDSAAELGARDKNGATALHRAVRTRCASAVSCLLDAGADPEIRNRPGATPFHLAVRNTGRGGTGTETAKEAQRAIIDAFLSRGIEPTLEDAHGRSVLDWAQSPWIREALAGTSG